MKPVFQKGSKVFVRNLQPKFSIQGPIKTLQDRNRKTFTSVVSPVSSSFTSSLNPKYKLVEGKNIQVFSPDYVEDLIITNSQPSISQKRKTASARRQRKRIISNMNDTFCITNSQLNPLSGPISPRDSKNNFLSSFYPSTQAASYSRHLITSGFQNKKTAAKITEKTSARQITTFQEIDGLNYQTRPAKVKNQLLIRRKYQQQQTYHTNETRKSLNSGSNEKRINITIKDNGPVQGQKNEAIHHNNFTSFNNYSQLSTLFQPNISSCLQNEQILRDDKCIVNNAFNIIQSHTANGTKLNSKIFSLISPREMNKTQQELRSRDKFTSDIMNTSRRGSNASVENNRYSNLQNMEEFSEFQDFTSIKEYFHKHEYLKQKYANLDFNSLRGVPPEDFFILHRLFPKVYQIKSQTKGTIDNPDVQFNPSQLDQFEIFLVKSVVYLHTQQWEKALFFLTKGQQAWPNKFFGFKFNQGLYYYLRKQYQKSVDVFKQLYQKSEKSESNMPLVYNLILSLIQVGNVAEVQKIQQELHLKRLKMTMDIDNIKVQKLLAYADQNRNRPRNIRIEADDKNEETFDQVKIQFNDTSQQSHYPRNTTKSLDTSKAALITFKNFTRTTRNITQRNKKDIDTLVSQNSSRGANNIKIKKDISQNQTSKNQTPKKYQTHTQNKAKFQIEQINSTYSPDYVLSMTQILEKLNNKDDIRNNKQLQYQLKQLENNIMQNTTTFNFQKKQKEEIYQIIPFPFQKNRYQEISNTQEDEDVNQIFPQVDKCLRNLEELEIEVALSNGGNIDKQDPILQQYKIICNSIFTLCKEEGLFNILKDAQKKRKEARQIKRKALYPGQQVEVQKYSVAKDILVSALLKKNNNELTLDSQNNPQKIEIEVLKDQVYQLRKILEEDDSSNQKKGIKSEYIDQAESNINKLLAIARKKQKEREKIKKQELEDQLCDTQSIDQGPLSLEEQIIHKSLPYLLKRQPIQEIIAKRFRVDRQKYLTSLVNKDHNGENGVDTGKTYTANIMKNFQHTMREEFQKFQQRSEEFLTYLFDEYGAYFICSKAYCLSELLDQAPENIQQYFEKTAFTLSTIPIKFNILTDTYDDNEFTDIEKSEFIYNKNDLIQKFISQSLRYQRNIDYLGMEKHEWIVEVIQKFNLISVLNYLFREGLSIYKNSSLKTNNNDISQRPNRMNNSSKAQRQKQIFSDETLKVIREQYAKLKFENEFNGELIDKFLNKIPLFSQFNKETRLKLYEQGKIQTFKDSQELQISQLNQSKVLVILGGCIILQGEKDGKWLEIEYFGPSMAIPIQHIKNIRNKYDDIKLVVDMENKSFQGYENIQVLEYDKKQMSNCIFGNIKFTILKKIQILQGLDLFCGNISNAEKNDKVSPYVLFTLGILTKVQCFKYSEVIQYQEENPKCMYVIIEGQAKAVYEDELERRGTACIYSRRSIRTDIPDQFKFGSQIRGQQGKQINQSQSKKQNISSPVTAVLQSPKHTINQSMMEDYSIFQQKPITKDKLHISYQNYVFNDQWSEHKPVEKVQYRHHIEFDLLQEGSYFASRGIIDEAAVKNFIKTNTNEVKEWISRPKKIKKQNLLKILKGATQKQQVIENLMNPNQEEQDSFQEDEDLDIEDFQIESQNQTFQSYGKTQTLTYDPFETMEFNRMKNFILHSQVSMVVTSSTLKVMVIYRQDKSQFNETIKKLIDERIQEKNFIDRDRPLQKFKDLMQIRGNEIEWDQFKKAYEKQCLKQSYYQKFSKQAQPI